MASVDRSFPQKSAARAAAPVARTASSAGGNNISVGASAENSPLGASIGRPATSSRPSTGSNPAASNNKAPPLSTTHIQPGQRPQAGGAAAATRNRSIPPPLEYDYDYYDDEMGVSGAQGLLDPGDEGFEPYEPSVIDFSSSTTPAKGVDAVEPDVSFDEDATVSLVDKSAMDDEGKGGDKGDQEMVPDISPDKHEEAETLVSTDVPMRDIPVRSDATVNVTDSAPPPSSTGRFAEILDAPTTSTPPMTPTRSPDVMGFMAEASNGNGKMTQVDILLSKAETIKNNIYAENDGKEFNVNSPKQVAKVLFGDTPNGAEKPSTNKDVLDAMAGAGNKMADLILQYRQAQRDLKRAKKQEGNKEKGIHVDDFHKAAPNTALATSGAPPKRKGGEKGEVFEFDDANGSNPLLLVDASAYIFRAYYSMPPLHRSDGTPVGAVLGFCIMLNRLVLNKLLAGSQPRIVLVFDSKGKNFRHELYPEYKANRPPCPEDLIPQFDLIRDAAEAYGIDQIEAPAFEADDVIATLATIARGEGINVHVLSGDKDLMQLVTPPDALPSVNMIDPKEMIRVTHDVVVDKWGVPPSLLGDVLALAGDSADNIPGVPGIGPKIARDLINEYESLEALLERAEEIKQKARRAKVIENADKAILSRKLVELDTAVPLESMTLPEHFTTVSELKMAALSSDKLLAFYEEMGFQDLTKKLKMRLAANANGSFNVARKDQGGSSDANGAAPENSDDQSTDTSRAKSEQVVVNSNPRAAINENVRQGLIVHNRRRQAPPRPEDFSDVPF